MSLDKPEMNAEDVAKIVNLFDQNQLIFQVDGGWGVDALLGRQTRRHGDLDIAMQHQDVQRLRNLLSLQGYKDIPRDDSWECNFVLGDDQGHQIDIHTYSFDAEGRHIFGLAYPFESLAGRGSINGVPVRCITPEWMVKFHSGYTLDENDYHDVKALCQHFGFAIPSGFEIFYKQDPDNHPL